MLFRRHKGGDRGSRRRRQARRLVGGTTWNFSQRLPWWFEATLTTRLWWLNAFAARFGILEGALCSSRSTLDLGGSSARGCVAVWDWRLMGQCCVFRQLHTDLATSVSQSRVLLRLCRPKRWRLVARGRGGPVPIGARHAHFVSRSRRPGIEPVSRVFTRTDASDVFASVAPSRLRIAWECQRDSRPLVFVVALALCFRFAPACFCLLS